MFFLARELGMMVSDVESRMSYREFHEWARFYNEQTSQTPGTTTSRRGSSQALDPNAPETEALFRCWAKNLPRREEVGKLSDGKKRTSRSPQR